MEWLYPDWHLWTKPSVIPEARPELCTPEDRLVSWTPENRPTQWNTGRCFLSHKKPSQHPESLNPREPQTRSETEHTSPQLQFPTWTATATGPEAIQTIRSLTPNLGRDPLHNHWPLQPEDHRGNRTQRRKHTSKKDNPRNQHPDL